MTPELRNEERMYVDKALSWSGWGSPVGWAILLAAFGFFIVCLHWAGFLG